MLQAFDHSGYCTDGIDGLAFCYMCVLV